MKNQNLSAKEPDEIAEDLQLKRLEKWSLAWQDKPWSYALVSTLKKLPILIGVALIYRMHQISNVLSDPSIFLRERWWFLLTGFLLIILYHRIVWNNYAFTYYLYSSLDPGLPHPAPESALVQRARKVAATLPVKYNFYHNKKFALVVAMGILVPFIFFMVLYFIYLIREGIRTLSEFQLQFDPGILPLLFVIFSIAGALIGYGIWKGIRDHYRLLQKAKLSM